MRHVLEHEVGGQVVVGIWDDELDRGRMIWVDGRAYDLVRPRDDTFIERIIGEGGVGSQEHARVLEDATEPVAEGLQTRQLSLFG